MPKGPKGEKRPADVVGAAVKAMKVHPSQVDDLFASRWRKSSH